MRIPPRSPNHNAVVERFHETILQECWRPAFHRRCFTSARQLEAEADAYLLTYNRRRRNHGDYMRGRTPQEILDSFKQRKQHEHHQALQRPSVTSTSGPEDLVGALGGLLREQPHEAQAGHVMAVTTTRLVVMAEPAPCAVRWAK